MFTVIDGSNQEVSIPLADFHTHIGKVAIETTKGASQRINRPQDILDLYEKLKYELYSRIERSPDDYYITLPSQDNFVTPLYSFIKNNIYSGMKLKGWIADQIVSFPFNDIFHSKTNPKFVKSNEYVRHSLNKFEFAFRFIPFCRVDATDDKASQEVINSAKLGSKGLKLHPLSQNWIDKIVTPETKSVLQTAGKLKLPVIFDVPNKGVAEDITKISIKAREEVDYPINVILGHNGFDYSSPEIFECLNNNGMLTEISGMRGSDVELFFKNVVKVDNWYEKVLYGTDTNYFSVLQAVDFISFLLSNKFLDIVKSTSINTTKPLEIVSRILGLNALNIIPLNQENKTQLDFKRLLKAETTTYKIPLNKFVLSLKNITPKKEINYNIALLPSDNIIRYSFYLNNGINLYEYVLKSDSINSDNVILIPLKKAVNTDDKGNLSLDLIEHFIKNEFESENNMANKENYKQITSLDELIQDNSL